MLDESPDKLGKQYKTGSTELYDRLKALFTVIDQGRTNSTCQPITVACSARRRTAVVPCYLRYLALGLDRLTRDVDDRTKALVFIDFKSLGVRHLGSIYEGLLEFKPRSPESSSPSKGKGKEVRKPADQVKKPLVTINQGEVYLENDKQERKATGSYYTPDYIVTSCGIPLGRCWSAIRGARKASARGPAWLTSMPGWWKPVANLLAGTNP